MDLGPFSWEITGFNGKCIDRHHFLIFSWKRTRVSRCFPNPWTCPMQHAASGPHSWFFNSSASSPWASFGLCTDAIGHRCHLVYPFKSFRIPIFRIFTTITNFHHFMGMRKAKACHISTPIFWGPFWGAEWPPASWLCRTWSWNSTASLSDAGMLPNSDSEDHPTGQAEKFFWVSSLSRSMNIHLTPKLPWIDLSGYECQLRMCHWKIHFLAILRCRQISFSQVAECQHEKDDHREKRSYLGLEEQGEGVVIDCKRSYTMKASRNT